MKEGNGNAPEAFMQGAERRFEPIVIMGENPVVEVDLRNRLLSKINLFSDDLNMIQAKMLKTLQSDAKNEIFNLIDYCFAFITK